MKIFLVTALLLALGATEIYSQTCHLREVDLCTAMGMFHYQSNGVPADDEKVTEWCETMKEVEECMGNFSTKCLSPLQREVIGLLSGSDDETRQMCVQGSEVRARYLKHAQCLSEGAESDEFKGFMRDMQVMVEKLFEVQFKNRFPLMCCGFSRFYHDVYSMTERNCGADAVDMVKGIVKMVVTDLPDTICQRFEHDSGECNGLLPPTGTTPKGGESKSQIAKLLDTVFNNS